MPAPMTTVVMATTIAIAIASVMTKTRTKERDFVEQGDHAVTDPVPENSAALIVINSV